MNETQLRERMTDRLIAAQTPWGRLNLQLYVKWKRGAWQVVVGSAFFLKRTLDIIVSLIALALLSPVFLVLAILVKRDGGPAFFKQTRIGLMGKEFKMLKFRSMVIDAEARLKDLLSKNEAPRGVTFQLKDDPRVTPLGRFIRRSSLDELPQFWNVLKGDMSLVGPRPPVPREVALYSQADRRRLLVKPGITCLWQVGERHGRTLEIGDRFSIDFPEQVDLDVRYIESQSFWKDLLILAKTVPAILFGKRM
jgi:lipopolysaccharide/colanic/teichoic acid biosynthesis glycosyltransferase